MEKNIDIASEARDSPCCGMILPGIFTEGYEGSAYF